MHATVDRLRQWGAEKTPVVAEDGGRHKMTGHIRKDFGKSKGEEMKGIKKVL